MKSDGVQDIVRWMEAELKKQKARVEEAEKDVRRFGYFEDCGPSYDAALEREQGKLSAMVQWKISTEKYMKKLRHEGQ